MCVYIYITLVFFKCNIGLHILYVLNVTDLADECYYNDKATFQRLRLNIFKINEERPKSLLVSTLPFLLSSIGLFMCDVAR